VSVKIIAGAPCPICNAEQASVLEVDETTFRLSCDLCQWDWWLETG
jgi:transcription elongation factor Elf1